MSRVFTAGTVFTNYKFTIEVDTTKAPYEWIIESLKFFGEDINYDDPYPKYMEILMGCMSNDRRYWDNGDNMGLEGFHNFDFGDESGFKIIEWTPIDWETEVGENLTWN